MYKDSFFGKDYQRISIGEIVYLAQETPLVLTSGAELQNFPVAYQTYGTLNDDKSNAILICHALTGDQFVASKNPVTGKEGWWDYLVGSGKVIDSNKYFIICINVLGSCMGTAGPKENNQKTNSPYNLSFPIITIEDMVNVQKLLINEVFSIEKLLGVIGGSMGGMQALEWAAKHPDSLGFCTAISTASRHTAQNIAFHEIGRQAIMADQNWCSGKYIEEKKFPEKGLSVARMTAHVTYLSENALADKFGRNLQDKKVISFDFAADFQIESYLRHQGIRFVDRFDANSYLYITRAMDYFDLSEKYGDLSMAFANSDKVKFCIISFSDDWLFPTSESKIIVKALNHIAAEVSFAEIDSNRGHDSFLIENERFKEVISGFLSAQDTRKH